MLQELLWLLCAAQGSPYAGKVLQGLDLFALGLLCAGGMGKSGQSKAWDWGQYLWINFSICIF